MTPSPSCEMKEAKAEAAAAHKEFATKERASKKQVAIMAAQTASYKRMKAEKASKLRGIESEIRAIEARRRCSGSRSGPAQPAWGRRWGRQLAEPDHPRARQRRAVRPFALGAALRVGGCRSACL